MGVVSNYGEHVEVAALPHVFRHLDGDELILIQLLMVQLVLVVGLFESLPLLIRTLGNEGLHNVSILY